MQFSVLMSVYIKENSEYLNDCLLSIYNQTLVPHEVIIVEDGPLTLKLLATLDCWESKLSIVRVKLPTNMGLGTALNEGLNHCSNELVARMDSDDICEANRFEIQINEFNNNIDVCGSWIFEFETCSSLLTGIRKVPKEHIEIEKFAKFKNPINHPSALFKKSMVMSVGGYEDVPYFEDYFLWLKLLHLGANFSNICYPLVKMRAGSGQLTRRSGVSYALKELYFWRLCYSRGYITIFEMIRNMTIRIPLRLFPSTWLALIYRKMRGK